VSSEHEAMTSALPSLHCLRPRFSRRLDSLAVAGEPEPREPLRLCVSFAVNNAREIARHAVGNFLLRQQL
jgi:hypothetical protein